MTASIAWRRRQAAVGRVWAQFRTDRGGMAGLAVLTVIVLLAVLAPVITDPAGLDVTRATGGALKPPGDGFLLGTDENGRSVLLLLLWGSRVSLVIGFVATLLCVGIGAIVGILMAHFGGWVQAVLMRATDFFLILPSLVLAAVLSAVLTPGIGSVIVAIAATAWPTTARLVRSQTLAVESRPYIERSWALGAGHWHVIGKHVVPAVLPLVFANTTLTVGNSIITESTLAFLGLGDPNSPSWGQMLHNAFQIGAVTARAWWYLLPPGVAIGVVVLSFMMCGRALEAVLNPRLRER